ncbi:MAG: YibE/F family protein [Candidatus Pacebacteria bacterium]|nr:YibE/F family protein [Candidatus Paceibacterota bacterium]
MRKLLIIVLFLFTLLPGWANAQENTNPGNDEFFGEYRSGKIIDVTTDDNGLRLYLTRMSNGEVLEVNTYGETVKVGSKIYIEYFPATDTFNYATVDRSGPIFLLTILFVGSILILAGKKGARSLISLVLSFVLLFFVLVPMLTNGFDPILTTLIFGLCVLFLSIFVTHGFNRQSLVSFLGSFASILVALILLQLATEMVSVSGLINEHIGQLNFELGNTLNLVRIVSAGIIIGILGVLDDITITQVAVVRELSSDTTLSKSDIFKKSLRVGRDHISSLVNTLVFAYMGSTLPLIMFVSLIDVPFMILIGQEFIFIEIIRSLIGAIALTIAVPVTTYLAVYVFLGAINKDEKSLESACGHTHH